MRENQIADILAQAKLPINHPLFFNRIFALVTKSQKSNNHVDKKSTVEQVIKEEYEELSRRLDRSSVQESCSVRNVLRTRRLAAILIDNQGEIRTALIPEIISLLKANLYSLGPNRQHDAVRQEHILRVLTLLHQSKDLARALKKISKPFSHKHADQIIRDTLQLPEHTPISDALARRAALCSWMCYLRQNIGSCFATAPAEIIHDEQPERYLADLDELLSTGRLKRTFGGIEYAVPLSTSWGGGDLKKTLLLYQTSPEEWQPEVWFSPGLSSAFTEIGLLDKNTSLKQRISQIKQWTLQWAENEKKHAYFIAFSAETLIRYVIMNHLSITQNDLNEYENRPQGMPQTQFMIRMPKSNKGGGGIGERCAQFYALLNQAESTFKSLADNALLKSWEFTLASFAETKADFATWNLYSSLGLGPQDPGGIGECLYNILKKKIDYFNEKAHEIQFEYEQVYTQLQIVEGRVRSAATEQELQWLRAEYQSRRHEFNMLQEVRDSNVSKAKRFAALFDFLIDNYMSLFRDYFQEVYDADMHDVSAGPFDDSPAGFRLLYKHGRANTSQWTKIQNGNEFIEALSSFFVATEPHISSDPALKGMEREFSEIVTSIINHIKTREFLETAFYRMAAAHRTPIVKDPLTNLDKIEKKPWAYTSGGTMNTLVSCYYRNTEKPTETNRWVENETELLVYLLDTMKQLSPADADLYFKGSRSSILMHSPTHAFLLKPHFSPFFSGWQHNDTNTYIWARDNYIASAQQFVNDVVLDEEMMQFLVLQLLEKVPFSYQHYFKKVFEHIFGKMSPLDFRQHLITTMEIDRGLNIRGNPVLSTAEIDSLLYSQIPLFHIDSLKERLEQVFSNLPEIHNETVDYLMRLFDQIPIMYSESRILGSNNLQDIAKTLLCLAAQCTSKSINYHALISETVQKLGFAMPRPMLFADTNWVKDLFGFVVNPGNGKVELWRLDCTGTMGNPMPSWTQWLNGSQRDSKWGVYIKPQEYGQS